MSEQPAGPRMVCPRCGGRGWVATANVMGDPGPPDGCDICGGVGSLPVQLTPESAQRVAREVVAARLAELADKEGDLMFDYNDYKSNDNGYEQMTVWIEAKALIARLFPETP